MRSRPSNLLFALAAFGLLDGALVAGRSVLLITSTHEEVVEVGRVGLIASAVLLGIGGASLACAWVGTLPADRPRAWRSLFWWGCVAAVMVIPTAVLFGPSGGFHGHIGFGPFQLFYMMWDGEDPTGRLQIVRGYDVQWFSPVLLGVLVAVWGAAFAGAVAVLQPTRRGGVRLPRAATDRGAAAGEGGV